MPGLTKLRQFKDDKSGCWASVILASGEPCWISVAGGSVVVKRSRLGLFGAPLYKEGDIYKNTMIVKAIAQIFPARALPAGFSNSFLSSLTNAALHCTSSAEMHRVFSRAIRLVEQQVEGSTNGIDA